LKICITSGTFHPDIGGPPTYLAALAEDLLTRGHPVRVVTFGSSRRRYRYPVHRISRNLPELPRLGLMLGATLRSARGADLLFVNDYGLPPAAANLVLRKPLVMKIVGDFAWEYAVRHRLLGGSVGIDEFQGARYGPRVERIRAIQTWYARQADLLITPSQYLAELVRGWGVRAERVRVIPNASPPAARRADREALRSELGLTAQQTAVAVLARLNPWKGVDLLIRALTTLLPTVPNLRLLVVGDGEERPALENLASPLDGSVRFLGELPRERALEVLDAADWLVLCSAYEGLSHVLLEAMAAGKAIVASSAGGNLELIRHEVNGLVVPYGDQSALEGSLLRLASEPGLATGLASRARLDAQARSWPSLVSATLALFEEACARRASRPS
jgi:glycosyltransferase involved in cell wall biosynthesis